MKIVNVISGAFVLLTTTACDSFRSSSSVFNASVHPFRVSASFTNVPLQEFVQAPETHIAFTVRGWNEPIPFLSCITAKSVPEGSEYSLTTTQVDKLRTALGGEVDLVLFDSGFTVVPPDVARASRNSRNMPEILHVIRQNESKCVEFTRGILDDVKKP